MPIFTSDFFEEWKENTHQTHIKVYRGGGSCLKLGAQKGGGKIGKFSEKLRENMRV